MIDVIHGALAAMLSLGLAQVEDAGIKPTVDGSTLEIAGQTLRPLRIRARFADSAAIQEGQRVFADSQRLFVEDSSGSVTASAAASDGSHLALLGADKGIAYLRPYRMTADGKFEGYAPSNEVRRWSLDGTRWLEPIRSQGPDQPDVLRATESVLAKNGTAYVLTYSYQDDFQAGSGKKLLAYEVSAFESPAAKLRWSKQFPVASERKYRGVFLWHPTVPFYARSLQSRLTFANGHLLVLAGGAQPYPGQR